MKKTLIFTVFGLASYFAYGQESKTAPSKEPMLTHSSSVSEKSTTSTVEEPKLTSTSKVKEVTVPEQKAVLNKAATLEEDK